MDPSELVAACERLFGRAWREGGIRLEALEARAVQSAFRQRAFEVHPDRAQLLGRSPSELTAELQAIGAARVTLERFLANDAAPSVPAEPTEAPVAAEPPAPTRLYRGAVPSRPLRFGEFLYFSAWISRDELRDAVAWQAESRPRFGAVALELRLLRRGQLERLLGEARRLPIGEHAVARGVLTGPERDRVLGVQRRVQAPLGGYFVELGLLAPGEVREQLRRQRLHNRRAMAA